MQVQKDPYDFDVTCDDLSIATVKVDNEVIILNKEQILNPFYVSSNNIPLEKLNKRDIWHVYKRILILCSRKNRQNINNFYNKIISRTDLEEWSRSLVLVEASHNILINYEQYNSCNVIAQEYLTNFVSPDMKLEMTELVVVLLELQEDMAKLYSQLYQSNINFETVYNTLSLNKIYNVRKHTIVQQNISNIIQSLYETNYWMTEYKCNITLNDVFYRREFCYDPVHKKILRKTIDINNDKEEFVDISNSLSNQKFFPINLDTNNYNITELFSNLSRKHMYDLFNMLLISKEYCHLVLKKDILRMNGDIIYDHMSLFKYTFGYAFVTLYMEECVNKTKTKTNYRYVFDIKDACELPVFPVCSENLWQNPYIPFLVAKHLYKNTANSIPFIANNVQYGVTDIKTFMRRFNLFLSGLPDKNILEGIDWSCCAVSGSVIPACLMKKSPLLDYIDQGVFYIDSDKRDLAYFNSYYRYDRVTHTGADVDMPISCNTLYDFFKITNDIAKVVEKNTETPVEILYKFNVTIIITDYYIKQEIQNINKYINKTLSFDELVDSLHTDPVKEFFYLKYTELKFKNNNELRKNHENIKEYSHTYNEFYKLIPLDQIRLFYVKLNLEMPLYYTSDSDIVVRINDTIIEDCMKVPDYKNHSILKICNSAKIRLFNHKMMRPLELFRTKNKDIFSTVSRFHLPCVRAYLTQEDGEYTVKILPSCLTAMLTGINIDYKYFAGARDPVEILNKYGYLRGFITLLNSKEHDYVVKYNKMNPDSIFYNAPTGVMTINEKVFRPVVYLYNEPNIYKDVEHKYIITMEDLKKHYKTYYGENKVIDMFKITTIDENGYITPIKKWVIDGAYLP